MRGLIFYCFLLILVTLTSCEVIGNIFSAGFYTALAIVVLVIIVIVWITAKLRNRD